MKNNFIRVLKMTSFYSFLGLLLQSVIVSILFASTPAEGQNLREVKVKINAVNVTLEQAFQIIEKKTNFKFFYIKEELPLKEIININKENETLYQILEDFARNYDLTFDRIDNQIVVRKINTVDHIDKVIANGHGTLHGTVTDSLSHDPLIGANIVVVGTVLGAVVDMDGAYRVPKIPEGRYRIKISYVGYRTKEAIVNINADQTTNLNIQLVPDVIQGKEIIVSVQALGQAAAINQQLNANTIVNVISEQKIQELPDANAAEAIGRLPGVSLQRSGGEANKIVLRGLSNQFSSITIDGVRIAPTDVDSRGVDLSTIAQGSLAGIELFKALTPDKDADAIAGSVNLVTKKAPAERLLWVEAKGIYNRLDKDLGQYDFSLRYGERFFDDQLGVQVTGNIEQRNRSNEDFNLTYDQTLKSSTDWEITNFVVDYTHEIRKRSGFSLLLDYNTPDGGTIKLSNIYNRTSRDYINFNRNYPTRAATQLQYQSRDQQQTIDTYNSSLNGENYLAGFKLNWSLSFAQSLAESPYDYEIDFTEPSSVDPSGIPISGMGNLPNSVLKGPAELLIPYAINNFQKAYFYTAYFRGERNLDIEKTAFLNVSRDYTFANEFSGELKFGGKLRYKTRYREQSEFLAPYYNVTQPVYLRLPDGSIVKKDFSGTRFGNLQKVGNAILLTNFLDSPVTTRNIYDAYLLNPMVNRDASKLWYELNKYGCDQNGGSQEYSENYADRAQYYNITERVASAYLMNTLNYKRDVTFIAGLRVESESNDYLSRFAPDGLSGFPTPKGAIKDTSAVHQETVWLPNVQLIIRPTDYMNIRLAVYKALARPDFNRRLQNYVASNNGTFYTGNSLIVGNPELKAAVAWNYEVNTSFFNNEIGLFTISAFYKNVTNMFHLINGATVTGDKIYYNNTATVLDSLGIKWKNPFASTQQFNLVYPYNSDQPTKVWGFEIEHQANLRFLPGLLSNIVINYNLSIVRSETYVSADSNRTIEYTLPGLPIKFKKAIFILYQKVQKLEGQPEFYGNFAIGYDIGGFSGRLSLFYQGEYNSSFSADGRTDIVQNSFTRWDLALKQKLSDHVSVMLNINNLTNVAEGTSIKNRVTGWTLQQTSQKYGLTADLSVRVTL